MNWLKKTISILSLAAVLANSSLPLLYVTAAYAQEVTPTVTEQVSPAAEPAAPTEAPAAEETLTPATVTPTPTAEASSTVTLTPAPTVSVAPTTTATPASETSATPTPAATETPTTTPTVTPSPVVTLIPTPTLTPTLALSPTPEESTSAQPLWQEQEDQSQKTSGKVEQDRDYTAPQNDKVRVKFSQLPQESGTLTIKEVKLSAEQVNQLKALSDTAYEITSTMADGTFTYDLTLPLPPQAQNTEVEVKAAESVGELSSGSSKLNEPKEKLPETITIKGLNHFTVFVVTTPGVDTAQRVLINEIAPTAAVEWVELFNNGTQSIDLTGWNLRNSAGLNQALTGTMAPASRVAVDLPAGWLLDTAPETVALVNNLGTAVDTVTVSLTAPGFAVDHYPLAAESVGRKTDGVAEWIIFATPSKGTANLVPPPATTNGALAEVGPVSSTTTFPTWFKDGNGLTLDLMPASDPRGISAAVDAGNPLSQQIGFGAEGFWWSAEADLTTSGPNGALLVQAVEAGFAPSETPVDGLQSAFARVRMRIDVAEPGTYTVTYPYGQKSYTVALGDIDPGAYEINDTADIGCFSQPGVFRCDTATGANGYALALDGGIGPFLTWDTFNTNAALSDPLLTDPVTGRRYVGTVLAGPHAVKGSPNNTNFFRITGPNIGGPGVNTVETNLFTVTGRLADALPPVITLHGANPVNALQNSVYTDAGATAIDDIDGNLTGNIQVTGLPLDTTTVGAKTVTYTVSDAAGHTTTATRTVNVVAAPVNDTVAPVITLLGVNPTAVTAGTVYTDAGATALDNVDGDLSASIVTTGLPIDTTTPNTSFTVTYTVTDAAGNIGTATRTVNVVADTTPPVITILGSNPINVFIGAAYVDAGATAIDNADGDLTASIQVTGMPISTLTAGTFSVTYTVTDSSGNTATAARTVNVAATLPAGLVQVGPVSPTTTFPSWFKDSNGLALELMPANDPNGISAPVDAGNPFSQQIGFGAEGFWFSADTSMLTASGQAFLTQAIEAAFAPSETPVDGMQSAFARIRIRVDVPNPGTYVVTFPYGQKTYTIEAIGPGFEINDTSDIGCFSQPAVLCDQAGYQAVLAGEVGPFLTWDTFNLDPALSDPLLVNAVSGRRYVGVDGINHAVKGSPTGNNFFRVEGPNIGGPGVNLIETNLFSVTGRIADVTPPVITLNGISPVDVVQNTVYTDAGATALDDFDGNVSGSIVTSGIPVDTTTLGAKTVIYTVADRVGNTATATRTVNVVASPVDVTPPVITLNGVSPASVLVGAVYTDAGATALDNVDGDLTASIQVAGLPINTTAVGTFTVTYTVTDLAGNVGTATRTVNVVTTLPVDVTPPVITLNGVTPVTVNVGTAYIDAGAVATDDVDGNITPNIQVVGLPISTLTPGTFTVTYTVTDAAGNTATAARTVNVVAVPPVDVIAPVITVVGANPATVNVGAVYTDAGATALDNVDGDLTASIVPTGLPVNTAAAGTFTITYTVTDAAGNVGTAQRTVNVVAVPPVDNVAPVITLNGVSPASVLVGAVYTDAGATALDNVDGDLTGSITVSGLPISTVTPGTFTITYTVSDTAGNAGTATRTVNVVAVPPVDNIAPVITVVGGTPVNVLVGQVYNDQGATALDDVDGDITANIQITGLPINTTVVGSFTITYSVSDAAGNTATAARTVNVVAVPPVDNVSPVITLNGANPASVLVSAVYTDAGATALDNVDGDLTGSITVSGLPINTTAVGSFTVTYSVTDAAGNTGTATRTVNVVDIPPVDNIAPIITIVGANPATVTQNTVYTDAGATATDNIDGNLTANISVTGLPVNTTILGVKTVTYTVTDAAGNISTVQRTVNVVAAPVLDNTPPVITLNGANPISVNVGTAYIDAGATALDDIDGNITPNIQVAGLPISTLTQGTFTITYSVSDAAGNTTTTTRTVNVVAPVDNIAPVIAQVNSIATLIGDPTPDYTFSSTEAGTIIYGGDCSSTKTTAVVGNNKVTFNYLSEGLHNNCTITVTDAAGNISNVLNINPFTIQLTGSVITPGAGDTVIGNGNDGQVVLPGGATQIALEDNKKLDVNGGASTVVNGSVIIGGTSQDLTNYTGGNLSGHNLTTPQIVADKTVTVSKAVKMSSGIVGAPVTINNLNFGGVRVEIPDGTTIFGPSSWDGTILPPTTGSGSGVAPARFIIGGKRVEVGSNVVPLIFDQAVTILVAGASGDFAFRLPGGSWQKMNNVCSGTYDNPTLPAYPGECYISDGTDTKILTYHFTTYANLVPEATTTSNSDSGNSGSNNSAPVCTEAKPGSAPVLSIVSAGNNEVTLSWTKANDPVTYYLLAYGLKSGELQFGNPNVGGKDTTTFTVKGLSGGTTYYFRVRAGNNCMPGEYSNEVSIRVIGTKFTSSNASGFTEGVLGTQNNKDNGSSNIVDDNSDKNLSSILGNSNSEDKGQNILSANPLSNITRYLLIVAAVLALLFVGTKILPKKNS